MIEERDGRYRVIARWLGYPYICVPVGTKKKDALAYHDTLKALRDDGRRDILELIANGVVELQRVHQQVRDRGARHLSAKDVRPDDPAVPHLGVLYDDWMVWLRRPGTTSPRTGRSFAPDTVGRYADSWEGFFEFLGARAIPLSGLTRSKFDEFADARITGGATPSTVNRDYTAFDSFFHWLTDHRPEIEFSRPKLKKRQEPKYDEQDRHLEPEEIAAVRKHVPARWWVLFELLYLTRLRISEMQFLLRGDVDFRRGEIKVVERTINRLKSRTSERKVPLSPRAAQLLRRLLSKPGAATDPVLPEELRDYDTAYRCFERACIQAGLHDGGAAYLEQLSGLKSRIAAAKAAGSTADAADESEMKTLERRGVQLKATRSLHSLRHTFGVACARAGLHPTVIRDLLGHSTISTTERYMRHATDADEARRHAQAIERSLGVTKPRRRNVTPQKPQSVRRRAISSRPRTR